MHSSCRYPVVTLQDGHSHGPSCGHELVPHGDHFDYVGDDGLLHHLLEDPTCCEKHSGQGTLVVSHGFLSTISLRKTALTRSPSSYRKSKTSSLSTNMALPIITKLYCGGICCPMEVPVIESALRRLPGILSVTVAVVTKTVTIEHHPEQTAPATMVAALNEAQMGASLTFPRQHSVGHRSWIPPWYILAATVLLIISLFHYLSGPTGAAWLEYLKYVALGAVALPLPLIMLRAFGALRNFIFDIHLLITIAAAGAIALGDYTEAGTVVVLFSIADFLESRCTGQARDAIASVIALKPQTAVLASTGQEIPAESVAVGTAIMVKAGEKCPLDGVVQSGTSVFDESILTGESIAVVKSPGDDVKAGTLNAGAGAVTVRTTTTSDDTFIASMARLVEDATSKQSTAEAMVSKFARIYTPLVLIACVLVAFVPWSNPNADRQAWVYLALEVLVIACPCALVLSTPVTVVSAIARAATVGVLIKGGVIVEQLASVKVVSFDKTGTLTRGSFVLKEFVMNPDHVSSTTGEDSILHEEKKVLKLLGSLERGSNHPLAALILGRAATRGVHCDATVQRSAVVPGFGVEGIVDGYVVCAGTAEFLLQRGMHDDRRLYHDNQRYASEGGLTTCFVSIDGTYVACIAAHDELRTEAAEAVRMLRSMRVTPAMLTGDNKAVAFRVAKEAGIDIDHVHAALLPEDKLSTVAAYRKNQGHVGSHYQNPRNSVPVLRNNRRIFQRFLFRNRPAPCKVAHVGDGVNDAPALAAADVGIAMGVAGAAAALEAGDISLFTNDVRIVPALHRLARTAASKIRWNISLSVVTKVIVLVLASLRMFTLWGAVLVDVGTALLVTLNGLTLLRWDFGIKDAHMVCIGAAPGSCCDAAHHHHHTNIGGSSPCCDHDHHNHSHHSHGDHDHNNHSHHSHGNGCSKEVELAGHSLCCKDATHHDADTRCGNHNGHDHHHDDGKHTYNGGCCGGHHHHHGKQ